MLVKRMAGSLMLISIGLTKAFLAISLADKFFWFISDWLTYLSLPVSFLSRRALRSRMLSSSVSGILMNQRTKTGPAIHKISQRDHRQPSAVTANPDIRGPRAGALKPAD